jgi:hypothetical protein
VSKYPSAPHEKVKKYKKWQAASAGGGALAHTHAHAHAHAHSSATHAHTHSSACVSSRRLSWPLESSLPLDSSWDATFGCSFNNQRSYYQPDPTKIKSKKCKKKNYQTINRG